MEGVLSPGTVADRRRTLVGVCYGCSRVSAFTVVGSGNLDTERRLGGGALRPVSTAPEQRWAC